ncbi:sugar ABC transporter permease, partial [Lachnotalea glycerini]
MKIKNDNITILVHTIAYILIGLFALACLLPFLLMISASFSNETMINQTGIGLIPKGFTTSAYA